MKRGQSSPNSKTEHRAGDRADGEGDRHVLRPALGEQQGVAIVVLDRPVVGDQRHDRPGHAERHEDDVERQRERHLRPRPRDGVHGEQRRQRWRACGLHHNRTRSRVVQQNRSARTANSPGMGDGRGRGRGLRVLVGELLADPTIERRRAMSKDIQPLHVDDRGVGAAGQPAAQQGHRVHHRGAGRPRAPRAAPHPRRDDRGARRPRAGAVALLETDLERHVLLRGVQDYDETLFLRLIARRHRDADADRVHAGGRRGVPEVQPDLPAPPRPVPVVPGRRPHGGDAASDPARRGRRHRRHRR